MWIQLTSLKRVIEDGKQVTKHPGEWVDVGRQTAQLWIAESVARAPMVEMKKLCANGGIVATGENSMVSDLAAKGFTVTVGEPAIEYERTCIWNPDLALRAELVPVGIGLLNTWEMAVPIASYDILAKDWGTEEDRAKTEEVIRDLRCLVYDPRLIFAKDCPSAREVIRLWDGGDELTLLRAIYRVKPFICALPTTWVQ